MFLVTSDFEHISILRSVVIQVIVSAWVLIPLANHSHTISSVATVTEKLNKSTRQTKSPDNFNTLNMFKNSTYTKFKTIFKHMLIL